MMLSIETSPSNLSLTLFKNNKVINNVSIIVKNELSEIIIPTIKNFLTRNLVTLKKISLLVVGCGPGSFTGIRTVISTAKGISLSNKHIKVLGINSLAGLAMSAVLEANERNIRFIISSIDSNRDDLYLQLFKINNLSKTFLPINAVNDIKPIKINDMGDYLLLNKIQNQNILFVGYVSKLLNTKIYNLKLSRKLIKTPPSFWLGQIASYIKKNNVDYNNTMIAFDEIKPIYVRSPEIN